MNTLNTIYTGGVEQETIAITPQSVNNDINEKLLDVFGIKHKLSVESVMDMLDIYNTFPDKENVNAKEIELTGLFKNMQADEHSYAAAA